MPMTGRSSIAGHVANSLAFLLVFKKSLEFSPPNVMANTKGVGDSLIVVGRPHPRLLPTP